MKKFIFTLCIFTFGVNLYSQEIKKTDNLQLNFGFMLQNNSLNQDTSSFPDNTQVKTLIGLKNEIIIPTKKENLNILIGYFFLHGRSEQTILQTSYTTFQNDETERIINNGSIYGGLNISKGNKVGFSSNMGLGMCFHSNTYTQYYGNYYPKEYSKLNSMSLGAIASISPFVKVGSTKLFLSLDFILNGNKSYMNFSNGASLGLSVTI